MATKFWSSQVKYIGTLWFSPLAILRGKSDIKYIKDSYQKRRGMRCLIPTGTRMLLLASWLAAELTAWRGSQTEFTPIKDPQDLCTESKPVSGVPR